MIQARIVAHAVFRIEDESSGWYQSAVIDHRTDYWLVATWLVNRASGERYPERIVPMARLPHWEETDTVFRIGIALPRMLLLPATEAALLRPFGCSILQGLVQIPGYQSLA